MNETKRPTGGTKNDLYALILIVAAFLGPIAWLSIDLASEQNTQIRFAEQEVRGAEHASALRKMLLELLRLRGTLNLRRLDSAAVDPGTASEAMVPVNGAVITLDELDRRYGAEWGSTVEWRAIRAAWLEFQRDLGGADPLIAQSGITAIGRSLLHHIEFVAEHSNLVLDPRLDINNVSQVMTFGLPSLKFSLADIRQAGTTLAAAPFEPGALTALQAEAVRARRLLDDLRRSTGVAFAANPALGRAVGDRFEATASTVVKILDAVDATFASGASVRVTPREWFARVSGAIADLNGLGDVLAAERGRLIAARVNALRSSQRQTLGVTTSLASLALVVAALRGRRVLNSIAERDRNLAAIDSARAQAQTERERAETASLAKSDFLAAMSHEIRTPLNGMVGFSDLLYGSPLTEEQRAWAKQVVDNADSLSRLLNDILDLSKIEAGKLSVEQLAVSPASIVEQCASTYRVIAAKKGLGFSVRVEGLPDQALMDPLRVRQVLLNFLANAVKFTPEGHIKLTARAVTGRLRFEVSDTGIGMDAGRRKRLFDSAYQTDAATTREFGGTGLGLQICARLVDLMGGSIGVESAPGVGSVLWFELPERKADGVAPVSATVGVRALPRFDPPLEILVADDVETNRLLVKSIAASLGCHVHTAEDGVEAVAMAATRRFDLILMDLHMPKMDGVEATMRIRGAALNRTTPIVALTASAYAEDAARCTAAGMNGHVAKPVRAEVLRAAIVDWGGQGRTALAPVEAPVADGAAPVVANEPAAAEVLFDEAFLAAQTQDLPEHDRVAMLDRLIDHIRELERTIPVDATTFADSEWQSQVHKLISTAGMLGALPLSAAAAQVDRAITANAPPAEAVRLSDHLLVVARQTRLAIAERR